MDSSNPRPEAEGVVFEYLSEPVENVQHYVTGGLHPIYLGDVVGNGRYKILRKLGYGGYSTVWLAQAHSKDRSLVAIKIVRADSDSTNEIRCYDTLRMNQNQHPGCSCIVKLNDYFSESGPNGNHTCLAYEVMGPSVPSVLVDAFIGFQDAYLTLSCARRVVYQILLGLDCMHSVGVVHGDIYSGNVLFAVEDLSQQSGSDLAQPSDDVSVEIERLSGPRQPGDPRHLTQVRPLNGFISANGKVKLADLGNSFPQSSPPENIDMPLEMRSPEMIFDHKISMAHDSWAFGCFIHYVFTSRELFQLAFMHSVDARDDEHLLQMFSILGPIPEKLRNSWPRYGNYFSDAGEMTNFLVDDEIPSNTEFDEFDKNDSASTSSHSHQSQNITQDQRVDEAALMPPLGRVRIPHERFEPQLYPSIVKLVERKERNNQADPETVADYTALNPSLREKWMNEKHPDMQLEESELVLNMLQGLLTYDPDKRLSTKELLQHDWIRRYCLPGGSEYRRMSEETATAHSNKRKRSVVDEGH